MTASLEEELDRLFQLPLAEFVFARNTLAAELKRSGDAEASKRVKENSKPTASAWAVNQLFWRARPAFDTLVAAGDAYRAAQQAALSGDDSVSVPEAERARRRAIDEALGRLRELVGSDGPTPGSAAWRKVETTLDAIASYGSANPNPIAGRLTTDLEPPGFAALASLAPVVSPPRKPSPREERLRAGELEEAKLRVERKERALEEAWTELERARERVVRAEERLQEARIRLEALGAEAESGEAARE